MTNQTTKPVCYLSGRITGNPRASQEFAIVRNVLTEAGWIVLDPTILPQGLTPEQYMAIDLAMLREAQVLVRLDGWELSIGARIEDELASYCGIPRMPQNAIICLDVSNETSVTIGKKARDFLRAVTVEAEG